MLVSIIMPPKGKRTSKTEQKAGSPAKKAKAEETSKQAETKPKAKAKKSADSKGKLSLSSLLKEGSWRHALDAEMQKEYFATLEATLDKDYKKKDVQIFPAQDLIFNAFNLTPLKQVKVVILGQDPYHDDDQAHGLSFSVPEGIQIPPSLRNMFKELEEDIGDFTTPDHGCLENWAKEGVFLLNATLTVEAHKPNSHKSYGWQKFTDEVIQVISKECSTVVFLLWGNFAHKKEKLIDTSKHVVLKDAHPSPLSFGKFQHCKCFSRANEALKKAGLKPVNWRL